MVFHPRLDTRPLCHSQLVLVAELRPQHDETIPSDVEALGLDAFAARLGVSRRTAHRRMTKLAAQQHRPEMLRVARLPVRIGSGAVRRALHVLWPKPSTP